MTNLIRHERLETTIERAKEMRPLMEKLIHKAKQNDYQGNVFLKKTIFTNSEIRKLKEIVKRYE